MRAYEQMIQHATHAQGLYRIDRHYGHAAATRSRLSRLISWIAALPDIFSTPARVLSVLSGRVSVQHVYSARRNVLRDGDVSDGLGVERHHAPHRREHGGHAAAGIASVRFRYCSASAPVRMGRIRTRLRTTHICTPKQAWLNPTAFHLAHGHLLPALELMGHRGFTRTPRAGSNEEPRADARDFALVRARIADADADRNAGVVRLEHVARSALVFDDFRACIALPAERWRSWRSGS